MWRNDPLEEVEVVLYESEENIEGGKVIAELKEYATREGGEWYDKQLYSNVKEVKLVLYRPK